MKLGLGNLLVNAPVSSVPLGERPTLGISFDRSRYTNPLGYANQAAVGSADFKLQSYAGPSPIFTRASAATFRGSNGLIQYAPENLLQYSEQFNNTSAWTTFATTVSPNAVAAPDDAITADALIESSGVDAHIILTTFSTVIGQVFNVSVYIKANGRNFALLRAADNTMPSVPDVISVDLINGTAVSALGSPNNISCVPAANGFFRVSFSFTSVASSTRISIIASTDGVYANRFYNGDITKGIYIWGAQLERSSTARPYISTTSAARYGPRFEYDLSGNPLGLLMEEQSTNLLSYSEQFDNGAWSKSTIVSVSQNQTTSPNGDTSADKLVSNTSNTTHGMVRDGALGSISIVSGSTYTFSLYVKKGTGSTAPNIIQLVFSSGVFPVGYANFNIVDGLVGSSTGVAPQIQSAGNGWHRCIITSTANATSSSTSVAGVAFTNNNDSLGRLPVYVDATTSDVFIWGAQLEQKPFATSYIPTVASAVTRNADVVSVPISSWYNTDVGTIIVEGTRFHTAVSNTAGFDSLFDFYNSTAASPVLRHAAVDYEQFEAFTTGFISLGSVYIDTEVAPNLPIKFGLTYDSPTSSFVASVNNSAVVVASGTDPLETPQTLRLGLSTDNSYWNGYIKSFSYTAKYWPDDIQALTA